MDIYELAKQYYPRLWDKSRIEALLQAGKLTEEQAQEVAMRNSATLEALDAIVVDYDSVEVTA